MAFSTTSSRVAFGVGVALTAGTIAIAPANAGHARSSALAGTQAAHSSQRTETAAEWTNDFNSWESSHGAPERIVAFVDHGTRHGVRYLGVELSWRTPKGMVDICGWFAVRGRSLRDPDHQIVGDGREPCPDAPGAA